MPVDIASGNVFVEVQDVAVPGQVPLVWARRFSNTAASTRPPGVLGRGWTHRYAATLTRFPGGFQFVTPAGTFELLPDAEGIVEGGGRVRDFAGYFEIFTRNGQYVVQTWNPDNVGEVWRYIFAPDRAATALRLAHVEDVSGQAVDVSWDEAGRLKSVQQRLERKRLDISYNTAGLIDRVVLVSPSGEQHVVAAYE